MDRSPLAEHQRLGVEWVRSLDHGGLLGDEPGLGKSRTAIDSFDGGRVLIVAPSMVITGGTWDDELDKWSRYPDRFTVAPYSQLNARAPGNTPNFGTKKNPKYKLRPEYDKVYDAVIVDEAHYIKGRGTSWTWAVEELGKRADSVLLLTGTPMPNWAHELFMLCRVINPEEAKKNRQFGSYWRWAEEWFRVLPSVYGGDNARDIGGLLACGTRLACSSRPPTDPCEHWIEFARENLGSRYLRRLRDDVLTDLPPITETVVKVTMDDAQKRMYREMKQDYLTNTEAGHEVIAWTNGSRNVMLDRITTSSWFLDKEGEPRGGKLERLRFDLSNRSAPTLVLAHYQETVEAAARVAESTGAKTAFVHGGVSKKVAGAAVADFKAGKLDVLVGSLETLAEGLTLTVADMAIFVEKSYKPSRNEQAKRRVHRIGQTRPVTVLDYVTPGTVDSNKRALLASKTDQQMKALSAADFARML